MNGKEVGSAALKTQGLYCEIRCQCKIPDHELYRLILKGDGCSLDLGICVPQAGDFGVQTRIPLKNIPAGQLEFEVKGRNHNTCDFIPVDPEKKFEYLRHLTDARFGIHDGVAGVYLTTEAPDQQGNGLIP